MRLSRWSSVWCFALAACGTDTRQDDPGLGQDDPTETGTVSGTEEQPGTDSGSVTPVCGEPVAAGTMKTFAQLAPDAGTAVLAAGSDGSVIYTAANSFDYDAAGLRVFREGVTKLDASASTVFSYPYGTVAAVDANNNVFVAGKFSEPRDFGTGVIAPNGNIDVFLVKLSPSGEVLFATTVGECGGTGVQDIAVAADGRIAISGSMMGTVVLDASGAVLFRLAAVGHLSFDSQGRLVVGGVFTGVADLGNGHRLTSASGDYDSFVVRYDVDGRYDVSVHLDDAPLPVDVPGYGEVTEPSTQALSGIAVGPNDEIAIAGAFRFQMDLFGTIVTVPPSFPSGLMAGTFAAKLDRDFNVVFARLGSSANASNPIGGLTIEGPTVLPGNPVAIDSHGNVIVTENTTGNAFYPDSYATLIKYAPSGTSSFFIDGGTTLLQAGYGLGVTTDACDNILWSSFSSHPDFNSPGDVIQNTYIMSVAP